MNHMGKFFRPSSLRVFCTLLALTLVLMLGASHRMLHPAAAADPGIPQTIPTLPVTAQSTVPPAAETASVPLAAAEQTIPAQRTQILLIGQDRQEQETRARSDALILLTLCPQEQQLILTSFLRDLYVEIPGCGSDRINAAYAYGGMELLRQTMEENFGLSVDGCIEVDFSRFSQIIDLLDGVSLELRQDEAEAINDVTGSHLTEGLQHLNGEETLAYARIRRLDPDGDFSRTERQRKVLSAVIRRCADASPVRLLSVLLKALPMVSTDLDRKEIVTLASGQLPALSEYTIVSQRIPADGAFSYRNIRNMEVVVADMESARKLLEDTVLAP